MCAIIIIYFFVPKTPCPSSPAGTCQDLELKVALVLIGYDVHQAFRLLMNVTST